MARFITNEFGDRSTALLSRKASAPVTKIPTKQPGYLRTWSTLYLLVSLLAGCNDNNPPDTPTTKTVTANVITVHPATLPLFDVVPGNIVSDGRTDVASRITGFIRQLDVREGQVVKRGDLLVRLDAADVDAAITQARAGVQAAQQVWQDAQHDVRQNAQLAPAGAISEDVLRKSRVQEQTTHAALEQAQSALKAALAQRDYVSIVSPVTGVIVSVARRSGELAVPGVPLLTIESREVLLFKAFIPEHNLSLLKPGDAIAVRIDALGDMPVAGKIRGIVPSADGVTRRYEVDVELPHDDRLLPGMFGRVEIQLGKQPTITVPRTAVVRRGGLDGVFVLQNGVARFRWLRTGRVTGESIAVTAGLSEGEVILALVPDTVYDGTPVQVKENSK
ncbi:efflux RND transporter periplasmic adaptor subunit [Citrobacter freundii]|uniref:efflux RND transporter periplasmic adaptor subunit n=1 Tax=Citrobacter freundii TaxID=546 RepID=UPI000C80FED4|nr:efflux RND transporter periplasmic adaptor subunit [Citrobacter freundii]EMB4337299.1 efflux RND transporter periplasmic adaptor subunit [Citrobacter freundii]MBJ9041945.1 efflux RND transporter periplasmic adaptor subunit [Citrobacter freundii]NTY76555.1 efflux RND transporter periplasmic adaptor subunit [Citrobacter freundii]NUA13003.1 efflux RND transporter periplasmic adaptor subunit [Citrobacter freundii]PMD03993.1 efflux RND transporter periplasmic adaptor subunit [Citrobacter freundi